MHLPVGVAEEKTQIEKNVAPITQTENVEELMNQLERSYDRCQWSISSKTRKEMAKGEAGAINFDRLKGILKNYGDCLLLCDNILNNSNLSEEQVSYVQNMAADIEKKYNQVVAWYSKLSIEDKLRCMNKDSDDITVDNLQDIIKDFESLSYFPQEQKNDIIKQMQGMTDSINMKYDSILNTSVSSLVCNIIFTWVVLYGIKWLTEDILWGVLPYIFFFGYIFSVIGKYKQLKSVSDQRRTEMPFKMLLSALSFTN